MKRVKAKIVFEWICPECEQVNILYKCEIENMITFMDISGMTRANCDNCNIEFEVRIPTYENIKNKN